MTATPRTAAAPPVGWIFTHATRLDPAWKPAPGERYTDAPRQRMEVTAVRDGVVYFRPVGSTGADAYLSISRFHAVYAEQYPDR